MKPRIAYGRGRAPMHVSAINGPIGGPYQIHIMEHGGFWGWLGFSKEIDCPDDETLAAQLDKLVAQSIPFSKGGMTPGPSDDLFFQREKYGWSTGYLEIAWRHNGDWFVREITQESAQWEKLDRWQRVEVSALLARSE